MPEKVSFVNSNLPNITISAFLNTPPEFDKSSKYPAIVVGHPASGVKEQCSGVYAERLARQGFVTLAFDASYQGESTGEPRQLEDPYVRAGDFSAVIDYLVTLDYVKSDDIGALGICASGGYVMQAAIQDHRIKAVGMVSGANIGDCFRLGWTGEGKHSDGLKTIISSSETRTKDAQSKDIEMFPFVPVEEPDASAREWHKLWTYYRSDHGAKHPRSVNNAPVRSLALINAYDSFQFSDIFLTQPLLTVAGSIADTKWMSDDLQKKAASKNKHEVVIEGADHPDLYNVDKYVDEAIEGITKFFKEYL